jgi:uncharacterized iron-regulated protein
MIELLAAAIALPQPKPAVVAVVRQATVVDKNGAQTTPDALWTALATARVVYVGEKHDRLEHHLLQLETLKALHARRPDLAVGLEMLSEDQQAPLDDFLAGKTSDEEFAKFWKSAWGFDFSLYRPILDFARDNHIPVRALNAPHAIVSQINRGGLSSLTPEQRKLLPQDIAPIAAGRYRDYIVAAAREHVPDMPQADLDRMLEAMAAWNETMAANLVAVGRPMLVIAGQGHALFGEGIASCAARRGGGTQAVLMPYPLDGERKPLAQLLSELQFPDQRAQADFFWLLPAD